MSQQTLQEDQLLELLLQLKKTTPDQARVILNSQPQIAYALMAVMVNLNAINVEVIQKILAGYSSGGTQSASTAPAVALIPPAPAFPPHMALNQPPSRGHTPTYAPPATAVPPHVANQPTPRGGTPTYPSQAASYPSYTSQIPPTQPSYGAPPQAQPAFGYGAPPPANPSGAVIPDALAAIPEEQKALIMRVIAMSPEEIHRMPPHERDSIIQLRATLGLPT